MYVGLNFVFIWPEHNDFADSAFRNGNNNINQSYTVITLLSIDEYFISVIEALFFVPSVKIKISKWLQSNVFKSFIRQGTPSCHGNVKITRWLNSLALKLCGAHSGLASTKSILIIIRNIHLG